MNINLERLMEDLKTLGHIGYQEELGTFRLAYSSAFYAGRDFVKQRMEEAGLETHLDAVGNLSGVLPSGIGTDQRRIVMGSHIDTVPGGGIYDGALGVIAAIEVIRTLREQGYENLHPLEVVAFNEEEGNVVGGTFGSKAFAGVSAEAAMKEPMERQHISEEDFASCRRNPENYLAYLEYHIEQGGMLEHESKKIGVVQGIFGILRYRAKVVGAANHAGSTPMVLRDDAMEKSCRIISNLMEMVRTESDTMVCTVGTMGVKPGAVNVIPGETEFIIELRDKEMTAMYGIVAKLQKEWSDKGLTLEGYITQPVTKCDSRLTKLLAETAQELGFADMAIYSGAGHDLINTSFIMPSALLFIPSRNGLSHHKDEYSAPEDIRAGTQVLLETIKKIDRGEQR